MRSNRSMEYRARYTMGRITYINYRNKMEFGKEQFDEIDQYCRVRGIAWFASCWDEDSVDFMEQYAVPCYKAPSASLTDIELLRKMKSTGKPLIISTGMSTMDEIETVFDCIGLDNLLIAHTTSTYPCPLHEINLRMIQTLQEKYINNPIGYSGHERDYRLHGRLLHWAQRLSNDISHLIERCGEVIRRLPWK